MRLSDLERDGWALLDAEQRHIEAPETFEIPARNLREQLQPGDFAKLLFVIATEDANGMKREPVERMWVVVRERLDGGFIGRLDSDPSEIGESEEFRAGVETPFEPRHVIAIQRGDDTSRALAAEPPLRAWPRE